MPGYGMAGHIGFGIESTWGTGVAATEYFKILSETLTLSQDRFEKENVHGGLYEPDDVAGVQRIAGNMVLPAYPTALGYLLQGVTGINSVTAVGADMHATQLTPRTSDISSLHPHTPFSLEIARDVSTALRYTGLQVAQLEMSFAPNQIMQLTAELLGKSAAAIAETTPTFPTTPLDPFHWDTCSISVGGAGVNIFESLTVTINNQLEGRPALNATDTIARIKRSGPQQIRISGTLTFEDHAQYDHFVNQSAQALSINVTRPDSFSALIEIPRMIYTAHPLGMAGREYQVVQFEGRVSYSTADSRAFRATVTDTRSGFSGL